MKNAILIVALMLVQFSVCAQAPNIQYAAPQVYTVGSAIVALSPSNTGGAVTALIYGQVSTFAGSGAQSTVDGTGTAASFASPNGVATDASGNVYVADSFNHKIRKITSAGVVSTFAGSGVSGSTNGTGIAASFSNPTGVAVDASGNVYVADQGNNKIRKITSAGVVSTLAGSGAYGSVDSDAAVSSFKGPTGVAVDASGNVYVADMGSNKIRIITWYQQVFSRGSGLAGSTDGASTVASFNGPKGVAVDAGRNLYVTDFYNNKIRYITAAGVVSTLAGSGGYGSIDGSSTTSSFNGPAGICIDNLWNVYVSENTKIRKITSGVVTTLAGIGAEGSANGIGGVASFFTPNGVAFDPTGNLYVADSNNQKIRKINLEGYTISPALPSGLNFDATTGTISGTPTIASPLTTYTITAYNTTGNSSTTVTIAACSSLTNPTFTAVSPICSGSSLSALPTTSNNSITGTWSPALNNTATTTYTFTPTVGLCATTTTMQIVVNPNVTYYADADGDTYGNAAVSQVSCTGAPTGYVANSTDCDDSNAAIHPDATEIFDGIDNNCNGQVDEGVLPSAPTANPQTLNTGSTVANLVATGSNMHWYTAVTGGTALTSSTVLTSGTYYVSQTVGGVESSRTSVAVTITSPYTAIPDANFEHKLFQLGIDTTDGDHQVLTSAISGVTFLNVSNSNINSLVGIQGFVNLQALFCDNNQLTSLNVSGLTALVDFGCSGNSLSTLNLASNTNLVFLSCDNNLLTSLSVNTLISLQLLNCSSNLLTSLNVSGLTALTSLSCGQNQLTSLSVSGLNALNSLSCYQNQLTSLNVSGLTALSGLNCSHNGITSLNLSTINTLTTIDCSYNQLTMLNVSGLTNLTSLDCSYNIDYITSLNLTGLSSLINLNCAYDSLTSLNLSGLTSLQNVDCNGNIHLSNVGFVDTLASITLTGAVNIQSLNLQGNKLSNIDISALGNLLSLNLLQSPNLTCVTVSNPVAAAANSNWWKDDTTSYSTNCGIVIPTSKIKANQCGATLSSLSANINADYYAGYQQYRFEVTNGATINTVEVNKYNFSLTQTPGIDYNTTYGVRVAVKMGGTWGAYGVSCNVTTPTLTANIIPTTTVMPSFCGITLAALDTKIGAIPVSAASGYRFEIVKGGVTTVYDSSTYNFKLSQAGVAAYGSTYTIRVAALINGVYGNYGASCSVTTPIMTTNTVPTTTILPSLCGTTLASKDSKITAVMITGATNGRYEITKAGSAPVVYEIASTVIKLSQTGVVVDYNTAYTIRVAAFIGGVWGNYGSSCTVTTPAAPIARLKAKSFEVAAYPNPFDSAFNLNLETPSKENVTVAVYNMMGTLVESHQVNPLEVANLQLGSNFSTGIYNVIVSQGDNSKAVRLIRK